MFNIKRILSASLIVAGLVLSGFAASKEEVHMSAKFQGEKANTGTVNHLYENGKSILRVSSDFKVPDTPAPTWRIVDSKGNVFTLDAFKIKSGEKRQIVVPAYVSNIAKVQVYCAWAEILLGETSFSSPVK